MLKVASKYQLMLISALIGLVLSGCMSQLTSQLEKAKDGFDRYTGAKRFHSDKPVLMFVLDGSGSMNDADAKGTVKMISAKNTVTDIVGQFDKQKVNVGLIAFNDGCYSSKLLVDPDNNDFAKVINITKSITPNGKTPLAAAIKKAGKVLKDIDKKVRIIVISDGAETCGGDPAQEARNLVQKYGIDVKVYVVGYSVDSRTKNQLEKIATAGNGRYFGADNADALNQTVNEIVSLENIRLDNFSSDGKTYTFHINFDTGSDHIKPEFLKSIQNFANYLSQNDYKVQIQGHTDSQSSEGYNQRLSERRAKKVVKKLEEYGISANRLSYVGYGEMRPVASNTTASGRYKNRRVEAHIIR